jgi:hypothetical protein
MLTSSLTLVGLNGKNALQYASANFSKSDLSTSLIINILLSSPS